MSIWFKVALFVGMLGISLGVVWKYNHAIEEAVTAKAEQNRLITELTEQKHQTELATARYTELDKALAMKGTYDNRLRKDLANFNSKLDELGRAIPEVDVWLNTPIPNDVRKLLLNDTGAIDGNGVRVPPAVADRPNAVPGN